MNMSDILYTIIISFLFILVIYIYIYFLYNTKGTYFYNKKISTHNVKINYKDNHFHFNFLDHFIIDDIKIFNDYVEIPDMINNRFVEVLDISKEISCNTLILPTNLKEIVNLKLEAKEVISNSKHFKIVDNLILDKNDNVVCIFKKLKRSELIEIANKYSIARNALYNFTNAIYYQFTNYKGLHDLRLSKPYNDSNEELSIILPKMINNQELESVTINYALVDYMYISSNIKRIIIEKNSQFVEIEIENDRFSILNDKLYDIINKEHISCGKIFFVRKGSESINDIVLEDNIDERT